jgi:hypothetical protein
VVVVVEAVVEAVEEERHVRTEHEHGQMSVPASRRVHTLSTQTHMHSTHRHTRSCLQDTLVQRCTHITHSSTHIIHYTCTYTHRHTFMYAHMQSHTLIDKLNELPTCTLAFLPCRER